ncbi:MAG TPA: hypothetical protein PLQ93_04170 [Bacteroidia bacterium]|nr:hypothetical protein [Bacteroidia bacterium]
MPIRHSSGISFLWRVLLFVFLPMAAQSQAFYTTDQNYLKSKNEGNNLITEFQNAYPDTSITLFHNYFPRNLLGNTGLSSPPYTLHYGTSNLGFRFFDAPTQMDRILEEDIRYYRSKGPYADLSGIAGSKQLQIFKLNYTQTFKNRMNFTIKLNRYNSLGYYNKQNTFANNLLFNTNYVNKKGNFGYYAYFLNNLNKNKENGGIRDSVLNDSTVWINKGLLDVKIDSAARENRETKIMFNPWFRLNTKSDSIRGLKQYLSFKSSYTSKKYRYRDQSVARDGFYQVFYFDSLRSNDSAHVQQFRNQVEYLVTNTAGSAFHAGVSNENNRVWQKGDSLFMNQIVNGGLLWRKKIVSSAKDARGSGNLESSLDAWYVLYGPNKDNLKLENRNRYRVFSGRTEWQLDLLFDQRNADHFYRSWQSNNFIWINQFKPVQQLQARFGANLGRKLSACILYQNLQNYTYLDEFAVPRQYTGKIDNLQFNLNYADLYFKHIGFHLNYVYQQSSSADIIRLPGHSGTVNLFYFGNLFNHNMQLQIGGQLQMYQSMKSYAFMPATQSYYLQNTYVTGNFPFLDLYLNMRIRPASFFIKLENVLAGYAGSNFALVQGYYQPMLAFRFGLSWLFFD